MLNLIANKNGFYRPSFEGVFPAEKECVLDAECSPWDTADFSISGDDD